MTREEKLWSMTAKTLQEVGDKLGVKITNSDIKKGKAIIIEKIMAAEAKLPAEAPEDTVEYAKTDVEVMAAMAEKFMPAEAPVEPVEEPEADQEEETKSVEKKAPKKANLKLNELTYKGETKSIKEWAEEINMPWPTLYDRVNRNGWPVELAIETPLGQRRPKNKEV